MDVNLRGFTALSLARGPSKHHCDDQPLSVARASRRSAAWFGQFDGDGVLALLPNATDDVGGSMRRDDCDRALCLIADHARALKASAFDGATGARVLAPPLQGGCTQRRPRQYSIAIRFRRPPRHPLDGPRYVGALFLGARRRGPCARLGSAGIVHAVRSLVDRRHPQPP